MTAGEILDLPPGAVHLWLTRPAAVPRHRFDTYLALLSDEERARHQRFLRDSDREMFLVAHGQLRLILSRYAQLPPGRWRFRASRLGRPVLDQAGGAAPLHFSLSHTDGLIAIAVSRIAEVGIDVERTTRSVDRDAVAPRVFTAREIAWIDRPPGDAGRFFQLWTLKEAWAKARGLGLSIGFRRAAFDVSGNRISVAFDPSLDDDPATWHFESTQPTGEHVCAVAVRRPSMSAIETIARSADDL